MNLVFVYGSLMRGEFSDDLLMNARFVKEAHTAPKYELLDLEYYPALIEGGTTKVSGELYKVSDALLAVLDCYEGGVYERKEILLDDGSKSLGYVLDRNRFDLDGFDRIKSGRWKDTWRN